MSLFDDYKSGPGPQPGTRPPTIDDFYKLYEDTVKTFSGDNKTAYYAGFEAAILMFMMSVTTGGIIHAIERFKQCHREVDDYMKQKEIDHANQN